MPRGSRDERAALSAYYGVMPQDRPERMRTSLEDTWDGKFRAVCPHGKLANWSAHTLTPFCRCPS